MATAAPPAIEPRPRTLLTGTVFAIAACVVYFAGAFGVYLKERSDTLEAETPFIKKGTVPLVPGGMMLLTAALSVVMITWAVQAVRNDDRKHAYLALGITLLFGLANINQQIFLFNDMGLKVANKDSAADLLIYVIAGSHVAMLVAAILFVGLSAFRALAGQYSRLQADGIQAAAYFWYATMAIYVCVWYGIYVTK